MLNFLKRINQPNNYPPQNFYNPGYYNPNINMGYDLSRIETEIVELKRITNDLNKRVNRLENYLGINQNNY